MNDLAIVIPTHNRKELLLKLLRQVNNLEVPKEVRLKVVVIVDGSTDGTKESLSEDFSKTHIVNGDGNWWWTKSVNKGLDFALNEGATHFLLLNDDSEVDSGYLLKLWADYVALSDDMAVLGSASVGVEDQSIVDFAGTKTFDFLKFSGAPYLKPLSRRPEVFSGVHPTWTLNGRGTLFSRKVIGAIGMLDEKLVQYGSDYDYALTARKSGLSVWISWNACVMNHIYMTSSAASFQKGSLGAFFRSMFNQYSINSLKKTTYLYTKHSYTLLVPFYLLFYVIAITRAKIIKRNYG